MLNIHQHSALISELQSSFQNGANVSQLIQIIKRHIDGDEIYPLLVMGYFREAFGISYELFILNGAECLGGKIYSNDEVDEVILSAIRSKLGYCSQSQPPSETGDPPPRRRWQEIQSWIEGVIEKELANRQESAPENRDQNTDQ